LLSEKISGTVLGIFLAMFVQEVLEQLFHSLSLNSFTAFLTLSNHNFPNELCKWIP